MSCTLSNTYSLQRIVESWSAMAPATKCYFNIVSLSNDIISPLALRKIASVTLSFGPTKFLKCLETISMLKFIAVYTPYMQEQNLIHD